ncbi:hypothetical protein ACP6PL_27020 [Dapis sp. BLCC M126]|uniref:hypothetical protein n=1 Tax=Dapis sp. BLCC M126 TaxID=3400189 RepID=UPI003CFAD0D4
MHYHLNYENESPEILNLPEEKASRVFLYQKQGKSETAISLISGSINFSTKFTISLL